jgi:DNA-directed RNA polymerase subunit RPC12/RpoP
MGIEEKATYTVRCDRCKAQLLTRTQPKRFKSDREAAKHANRWGWMVTSAAVRCPDCKALP